MSKKKKLFHKKEHELIDTKKKFTAGSVYTTLVIIAVLCFVAGYFISGGSPGTDLYVVGEGNTKTGVDVIGSGDAPLATGESVTSAENHMYYIISTGCSTCEAMKATATEIAGKLGIGVTVIEYTQQMSIPGYVLIYNNKLTINGINSKYSFEQTVCDLTANKDVCDMAAKDKPAEVEVPPAPTVPKTDKPKVEVFIMSYCPYGLQMEKAVVPVMETLGDKADIEIKWVNYLMHGEKERDENTRQYCIQKEQNDKFTDYFRCFAPKGDWEGCLDEVGIDKAKLDACIEATNTEFNVMEDFANPEGNFPRYRVQDADNTNYGVRGSPTTVINGVVASVSRSQQAVLSAVCGAFSKPPEECNTKLSTTAEAASLGPVGSGGTATDASC